MSEMLAAAKKRSKKNSSDSSASPAEPASSAKPTPDREILESANQVLVLRNEKMKDQIVRTMIGSDDEEKVFLGDWKNTMKVSWPSPKELNVSYFYFHSSFHSSNVSAPFRSNAVTTF